MNVPQAVRLLMSKQRRPVMNDKYPPSGRSGYPVANGQPGGR